MDEPEHPVLREEKDDDDAHRVTFFELFFDLVYVFAITQLSHSLVEHQTLEGAGQALLLLLAVWWAWVYTAWATNWLDPANRLVRLMLIVVMGLGLVMAETIPHAFESDGLLFAGAYAVLQVLRSGFVLWAFRDHPRQRSNFRRILSWNVAAGLLWVAGGFADGPTRVLLWVAAVVVDYAAPAASFWVPGLGRTPTRDWSVTGSHFAERFRLFVIIALGESIILTGSTFSDLEPDPATWAALLVAFVGTVAFWWIYFDRGGALTTVLEQAPDPGRLARSSYTYFHLPIAAGIVVTAVGDELTIAHPLDPADPPGTAMILGGAAIFLAGHALYKWSTLGIISWPRIVAIGVLGAVWLVAGALSLLALLSVATGVLLAVVVMDLIHEWRTGRTEDHAAAEDAVADHEAAAAEQVVADGHS